MRRACIARQSDGPDLITWPEYLDASKTREELMLFPRSGLADALFRSRKALAEALTTAEVALGTVGLLENGLRVDRARERRVRRGLEALNLRQAKLVELLADELGRAVVGQDRMELVTGMLAQARDCRLPETRIELEARRLRGVVKRLTLERAGYERCEECGEWGRDHVRTHDGVALCLACVESKESVEDEEHGQG